MDSYGNNWRAPKVDVHQFSMIPRADIPRSSFRMQHQHKTTFQASRLVPVYMEEVLPGDSFNLNMTAFVRLATPLYPIMDNIDLESFFFFVPNRLVWSHWVNFMGEQTNPADSISFSIPQIVSPVNGFAADSVYDYFGLPIAGNTAVGNTISISALPLRAYNLIWNQWFRDENLDNSVPINTGDGPDASTDYTIQAPRKRHDYFTSCLPWTQKGGTAVTLPLGTQAIVKTSATQLVTGASAANLRWANMAGADQTPGGTGLMIGLNAAGGTALSATAGVAAAAIVPDNLYADLSTATAATINQIRLAFQTQRLLERDARGGTRYTEIIRSHFGVISPDMRLQRPEYLGGGKIPINIAPVPQTSGTSASGTTTPLGTLAAAGTGLAKGMGFRQSFTEHGHVIGLVCVRQDQGYQQGISKKWKRSTRYDYYFPVFQALGEQPVLNYEIYSDGSAADNNVFGYQERWAEYRWNRSFATGFFRSAHSTPLDAWHLIGSFASLPALNGAFVFDTTAVNLQRAVAAGAAATGQQVLCDFFFDLKAARPMPMYSVPGMVDHF